SRWWNAAPPLQAVARRRLSGLRGGSGSPPPPARPWASRHRPTPAADGPGGLSDRLLDALGAAAGYAIPESLESSHDGLMAFLRAAGALMPRPKVGSRPVSHAGGRRGGPVRPPRPWRGVRR